MTAPVTYGELVAIGVSHDAALREVARRAGNAPLDAHIAATKEPRSAAIRECDWCGATFRRDRISHRFCSLKCRHAGRLLHLPNKEEAMRIADERSAKEPNSGCWLWLGRAVNGGYAVVWRERVRGTIRLSRAILGILADKTLVARHRCDTPACVNPDHLEVGSLADNVRDAVRRGRAAGTRNTHCKRGHLLSGGNVYRRPDHPAQRWCRECALSRNKVRYAAMRRGPS